MGLYDKFKNLKDKKTHQKAPEENQFPKQNQEEQEILKKEMEIRLFFEKSLLPSKIIENPIYMITSIIANKGVFLNNYYRELYRVNGLSQSYSAQDFNVSAPFDISDAKAIKIEMPKKNLFISACEYVYIIYNNHYTKHIYIISQLTSENNKKMFLITEDSCEEISITDDDEISITDDDEIKILEDIIKDEEISEKNYSDVLEKLFENAKPKTKLLEDYDEILKYANDYTKKLLMVSTLKNDNKRDEALRLIKDIIREETFKYPNSEVLEYHSFKDSFEALLFANLYHPYNPKTQENKQLVNTQIDISSAYFMYGAMLLEQKQYDRAIDILWCASGYNPVNPQILFALADCYRGKKYLKSYITLTKRAHMCAIKKKDISQIYKNYAFYYADIKDFDTAIYFLYASKYFDAQGFTTTLRSFEEITSKKFPAPSIQDIKNVLKEKKICWGANELVVSVVSLLDKEFLQKQHKQGIKMCQELKKELSHEG